MEGYYIQLFSLHGLIRGRDPEIGRDKDTGGQVKFVLELLHHLSEHPKVRKVDLFTRRISDKRVSPAYEKELEIVNDKARIVRISCGSHSYRAKETLWEYLDEYVDKTIQFIVEQNDYPDIVHGHYADGNYVAGKLNEAFDIPFVATGHSLGRNKQSIFQQQGWNLEKINEKFNMNKRIEVEENTLQTADVIMVSTGYEIESQYGLYKNKNIAHYELLPPGVNNELFYPFYRADMPSFKMSIEQEHTLYRINSEIERFLFNPEKPLILSIGRPDKRKNFETIIQSFGRDKELQAMANLAIFAGVRKDISQMPTDEQEILKNLLLLLDKYDLYGKMAIPKKNDPRLEVPEIYRVAARKGGVFVNATPGENFGLTIIEAAASGLPVVASPTGGPKEILEHCMNGTLVDVEDPSAISDALKKIISDKNVWHKYSENGIKLGNKLYSWEAHTNKYVEIIDTLKAKRKEQFISSWQSAYGKRLTKIKLLVICDLDGTLIDGKHAEGINELTEWFNAYKEVVAFGVASGRNKALTRQAFEYFNLPEPDVLICSAGTEIYYTEKCISDNGWESHIDFHWNRKEIQNVLSGYPKIKLQEEDAQWKFKLSYYVDDNFNDDDMANIHKILDDHKLKTKILLTENRCLDVLPLRASKGSAIRYLSNKWNISLNNIITAGNSGNDIDMLKGKAKGIVVSNYSPEMEELKKSKSIYFSPFPLSKGVLDGIEYHINSGNGLKEVIKVG
jgi:sucrose-phosphate synthase